MSLSLGTFGQERLKNTSVGKGIKKAWEGIFRLREGKMTVEIESVAINKTGRKASLRGSYKWAINGKLVALMVKDRQEGWKIQQVDYTNKKFGDQVDELENPAYVILHPKMTND